MSDDPKTPAEDPHVAASREWAVGRALEHTNLDPKMRELIVRTAHHEKIPPARAADWVVSTFAACGVASAANTPAALAASGQWAKMTAEERRQVRAHQTGNSALVKRTPESIDEARRTLDPRFTDPRKIDPAIWKSMTPSQRAVVSERRTASWSPFTARFGEAARRKPGGH